MFISLLPFERPAGTRVACRPSFFLPVRVLSPEAPDGVALVTITAEGIDVPTLASRLDREHGVLTRPGLHCAPEAHKLLGTQDTGAVRFSLGWANTEKDVDRAIEAVAQITAAKVFSGETLRSS